MSSSEAIVRTSSGSRYVQQLAKHWAHKFPVETTDHAAAIELPLGRCALSATPDQLQVVLTGAPDADMPRFQQVVAEHLQRFGFREMLEFDWHTAQSG